MKYELDGVIDAERNQVVGLLFDHAHMNGWQEGFNSFEELDDLGLRNGAKTRLKYLMGKRKLEMVETIQSNSLPESLSVTYEAKNVWNRIDYRFSEASTGSTKWVMECEFRCSGFIGVLSFFMPNMFKNSTIKGMKSFKYYCEKKQMRGE